MDVQSHSPSSLSRIHNPGNCLTYGGLNFRKPRLVDETHVNCEDFIQRNACRMSAYKPKCKSLEIAAKVRTCKGPQNISTKEAVRSLTNFWEHHSGRRPSTDKGRGARSDLFLELCKMMTGYVRNVIQEKSVSVGTLSLAGIVSDVLAEMAEEDRRSEIREK